MKDDKCVFLGTKILPTVTVSVIAGLGFTAFLATFSKGRTKGLGVTDNLAGIQCQGSWAAGLALWKKEKTFN